MMPSLTQKAGVKESHYGFQKFDNKLTEWITFPETRPHNQSILMWNSEALPNGHTLWYNWICSVPKSHFSAFVSCPPHLISGGWEIAHVDRWQRMEKWETLPAKGHLYHPHYTWHRNYQTLKTDMGVTCSSQKTKDSWDRGNEHTWKLKAERFYFRLNSC